MLTQTAEYALRAVLHLAILPGSGPVSVDSIADDLEIPRNYLSKVLHTLTRAGLLHSTRGPHGGFSLALDPESLTLAEVIAPFDPIEDRCLLMRRRCSDADPCLAHNRWKQIAVAMRAFFRDTTVADLLRSASEAGHPNLPFLPPFSNVW